MKNLSKSKYTNYRQCNKALWLRVHKPEVGKEDAQSAAMFEAD